MLEPPAWIGARHSSEVPFLFGTILMDSGQDELAKDLSLLIIHFWTSFIKTGWVCHAFYRNRRGDEYFIFTKD